MLRTSKWLGAAIGLALVFAMAADVGQADVAGAPPAFELSRASVHRAPSAAAYARLAETPADPRDEAVLAVALPDAPEALDTEPDAPGELPSAIATSFALAESLVIEPPASVPDGAIELPAAIATAFAKDHAATQKSRPTNTPTPTMTPTQTPTPTATPKPPKPKKN